MTQSKEIPINDYLELYAKQWRVWLLVFLVVMLAGAIILSILPETYRSRAEVYFGDDEIPDSVFDLSWQGYSEQRIKALFIRETTYDSLVEKVRKFKIVQDMSPDEADQYVTEAVSIIQSGAFLDFIEQKIGATEFKVPIMVSIGFFVGVDSRDPVLGALAANAISDGILEANDRYQLEGIKQAADFLFNRRQKINADLISVESNLKNLERANFDILPLQLRDKRNRLARLREQKDRIAIEKDITKRLLASLKEPIKLFSKSEVNSGVHDIRELKNLLDEENAKLLVLEKTYEGGHPDLELAKSNVTYLREKLQEEGVNPDQLVGDQSEYYFRLINQQQELQSKLARQDKLLADVGNEIEKEEAALRLSGNDTEREYNSLLLEYNVLSQELSKIKYREAGVNIALTLAESKKVGLLVLEEGAKEPAFPIYPNKLAYNILFAYLAIILAIIAVNRRSISSDLILSAKDVKNNIGVEPLGVVPKMSNG